MNTTNDARRCVAITGGTGFVGQHVIPLLTRHGYGVRALARKGDVPGATLTVRGDLFDDDALDALLRGCGAIVHLVGIIRENPKKGQTYERIHHEAVERLVARAQAQGVPRIVHMSALGTRANARSEYHRTKWRGEEAVRASGLAWTIFRPSLILGPGGEFAALMHDLWTDALPPFVPYFGKGLLGLRGSGKVQPIAVADVAHCFVEALNRKREGEMYELGGPEVMDWPTMYRRVRQLIPDARDKRIVAVPAWLAKGMASLPLPGLPFNRAQVIMAEEDSVCDMLAARRDFEFQPMSLERALQETTPGKAGG